MRSQAPYRRALLCAVVAATLAGAPALAQTPPAPAPAPPSKADQAKAAADAKVVADRAFKVAQIEKGKQLFLKRCAKCHGPDGDGRGPEFARLDPKPRDLRHGRYKFHSTASGELPLDEDIARAITRGIPGTGMVGVPLHVDEIAQVIAYIKTLHRPGKPSIFDVRQPAPALVIPPQPKLNWNNAARGRQIFRVYQCFRCHGVEGKGDGPSSKGLRDHISNRILPADLTTRPFKVGDKPSDLFRLLLIGIDYTPMPPLAIYRAALLPDWPDSDYKSLGKDELAEMRDYMHKQPKLSTVRIKAEKLNTVGVARIWDVIAYVLSLRPDAEKFLGPPPKKPKVP